MSTSGVGIYIWHTGVVLTNNSYIMAKSHHHHTTVPKFTCFSGSESTNVGHLIGVHGQDITKRVGDPFITDRSGTGTLAVQANGRFTSEYEGVYSCRMPDEHGNTKEIYFGIYLDVGEYTMALLYSLLAELSTALPVVFLLAMLLTEFLHEALVPAQPDCISADKKTKACIYVAPSVYRGCQSLSGAYMGRRGRGRLYKASNRWLTFGI